MSLRQIKSLVQFAKGNRLAWEVMDVPIPSGVVVLSLDDRDLKLGDGVTLYHQLPVLFNFDDLLAAQGSAGAPFRELEAQHDQCIVVAGEGPNGLEFYPSTMTIQTLMSQLVTIEQNNNIQDDVINTALIGLGSLNINIVSGPDDNLIVVDNGQYSDSGMSVSDVSQAIASGVRSTMTHLEEPRFYTDLGLTNQVALTELNNVSTYYVKLTGRCNRPPHTVTLNLESETPGVSITRITDDIVAVQVGGIDFVQYTRPVVFIASVDDGDGDITRMAVVSVVRQLTAMAAVYGGSSSDVFRAVASDSTGNYYCVGHTASEGTSSDALIVKFSSNLNIISRKHYGGAGYDMFTCVTVDSDDNVICGGYTTSEGSGGQDCIVTKFSNDLSTILASKRYGGSVTDTFSGIVSDSADNIICVGDTQSEGDGTEALILKFDSSLTLLHKKKYGGSANEYLLGVTTDSADSIICVGSTASEGGGTEALVIKFDGSLNIVARKRYGGAGTDIFYGVATDSSDNIICAGYTNSEGASGDGLVIKFDSSLDILYRKRCGGTNIDLFNGVAVDLFDNIICAGYTVSEGSGMKDCLVVRFDPELIYDTGKTYGGVNDEILYSVTTDPSGNIISAGSISNGSILNGGILLLPKVVASGTTIGTVLNTLTLRDSNPTVANSVLNLNNSTSTLGESNLTLGDSSLTSANSQLTLTRDVLD